MAPPTQPSEEAFKYTPDVSQRALREPKAVDKVHVGPGPPGELLLIVGSIPSQAPTEDHEPEPGLAQTTTPGTSGELKSNGNYSVQRGSTVVFTDEPAAYRLAATLDLSARPATLARESPWSWVPRSEPSLGQTSRPPAASADDVLPTFTNRRPTDVVSTVGKPAAANVWSASGASPRPQRNVREPGLQGSWSSTSPPVSSLPSGHASSGSPGGLVEQIPDQDSASSAFEHGPSPVTARHFLSSSQTPSGPSSLRTVPCPMPTSAGDISTNAAAVALPHLSSGSVSSMRSPPSSSPTPSSASCRSSSLRTGPPSSSSSPSSVRSPPCSSPTAPSSAFTRSLAASCISQSISHSLARKTTASQQGPPLNSPVTQSQAAHLRRRSPSPRLLAQTQPGPGAATKDGGQRPKCPASPPWWSCPSPHLSEHSPPPSTSLGRHSTPPSPRPSFLHSRSDTVSQNLNNNNNNNNSNNYSGVSKSSPCAVVHPLGNGACLVNPHKPPLANSSIAATHDPLWSGSHNRVARPFSASEPSSRVQSPSPSPTPASFGRLCSPPPQHNHSAPMANKPPHPRSSRSASAASHNPLGLTLELPRASSASTPLGQSCLSPRILSPPPIGVPGNVWTNNVAAPQPRNPRAASSSSLGSPSLDNLFHSSSYSSVPLRSSRATSPSSPSPLSSQTTSQPLRRSFSTTLAEVPPSPTESGVRRSWADGTLGFPANGQRSFVKQESCPTSPRSGWSSYGNSPPCLSPRAGLQSPISPGGLSPGKGTVGGQHFTSVPWPDVRELSTKYSRTDGLESGADSTVMDSSSLSYTLLSSPTPSGGQTEWGDPELEEGSCRSQLICAYVARPAQEQNLSSSVVTSPPFVIYQPRVSSQPQVQSPTPAAPVPSSPYPFPLNPPPQSFSSSSPAKQGNQRTSYATTVNLKIAGSGRITSFSTAQVSLTQTLQGGAGGPGPAARRVSINGLSQIPSPLPQN